ncbi:MAG: FIST C-terminal domain-containing protein [Endomicrobia bacterium]|nr:FIST C-terminal domain-containing protein [Endomicrobiia bacterium]
MLKMYTAHTQEADNQQLAVDELTKQIDLSKLQKNSIGIITFHYDFAKSGIIEEIRKKLPFEIIGMTTMAGAHTSGHFGTYSLFLTVLTSDDVEFSAAISVSLTPENYKEAVSDVYNKARAKFNEDPKFVMTFAPYMPNLSGADMTVALDAAAGGIPCWGSLASGIGMVYEECRTLFQDQIEQYSMALILFYGNIEPEFIFTSIPEKNMRDSGVVVTESEGCVLKKINDMPFMEYLKQINIEINNENCTTLPFMVYTEGTSEPVSIGIYRIYDDSSALFGTHLPVGTKLVLSQIDTKGILETAQKSVEKILASGKKNGVFMFPCVTRFIMQAPDQNGELKLAAALLAEKGIPYVLAYSGGEICPVFDNNGKLRNKFHNYSYSSVVF